MFKINESLDVVENTIERETSIDPIDLWNQHDAYIENVSENKPR